MRWVARLLLDSLYENKLLSLPPGSFLTSSNRLKSGRYVRAEISVKNSSIELLFYEESATGCMTLAWLEALDFEG